MAGLHVEAREDDFVSFLTFFTLRELYAHGDSIYFS